MRILTWNINGIRTIPQYHPWNTLKTHDAILNHLQADIINFQEVKSTRTVLPAPVALPPSYDAYYSFPLSKNGYSGVATYTRKPSTTASGVTAIKAEEGLTGQLRQPHLKPPLADAERVSRPDAYDYDEDPFDEDLLKALDAEGRVLTLDFGLFVLINVYCPNDGSTEEDHSRFEYKMAFHRLLEARVRALIREGREVMLLGDINACVAVIDHCEGNIIMRRGVAQGFGGDGEEYFWVENEARRWLRDLLEGEKKCLVDIVRRYHPKREGMFTCWNTKISARASNYGTRIDYILVTPGLLPWIKAADIDPSVKGSDHCPVWVELYEEIETSSPGEEVKKVKLRDLMSIHGAESNDKERDPPRLATRFWDEYSGKQRLLASFFTAGGKAKMKKSNVDVAGTTTAKDATSSSKADLLSFQSTGGSHIKSSQIPSDDLPVLQDTTLSQSTAPSSSIEPPPSLPTSSPPSTSSLTEHNGTASSSKKRKTPPPPSDQVRSKKQKKDKEDKKSGQSKLSSFFVAPSASVVKGKGKEKVSSKLKPRNGKNRDEASRGTTVDLTMNDSDDAVTGGENGEEDQDKDEDLRRAIQLSLSHTSSSADIVSPSPSPSTTTSSQDAWKSLLKPPEPPRCTVHNEIAKEFRVNKPGVNKGRSFWVCSRPVGPGYDKGRSERPREEVDSRWKCNFFVWTSELGAKRGK